MSDGKAVRNCLITEMIKKISLYKASYFPEPYSSNKNTIKV